MEAPITVGASKGMVPRFGCTMLLVCDHQQRIIEEHLLGLGLAYLVPFGVFAAVAFVPVETFKPCEVKHERILPVYTRASSCFNRCRLTVVSHFNRARGHPACRVKDKGRSAPKTLRPSRIC